MFHILRIILSLYKTLVRSHVEYCSSTWSPSTKKGVFCIWDFELSRREEIEFKNFKGLSRVGIDELFMLDENTKGTRGSLFETKETWYTRDITRHFLEQGGQ